MKQPKNELEALQMKPLSQEQLLKETIVLVALAKQFDAQATYLNGKLKFGDRQKYEAAVAGNRGFISWFEKNLPETTKEALDVCMEATTQ